MYFLSSVRDTLLEDFDPDETYLNKMQNLFSTSMYYGVPPTPTMIAPNVFLGTQSNGENLDILKRMKITHVLNCAGKISPCAKMLVRCFKKSFNLPQLLHFFFSLYSDKKNMLYSLRVG